MRKQSHPKLRDAIRLTGMQMPLALTPKAIKLIVWELMKTQTQVKNMDKQIRKIGKEVKKTGKDLKSLEKADKKRDKVCAMAKKTKKGK